VYLAELISLHPLYPAARRAGEEMDRLRSGELPEAPARMPLDWELPLMSGELGMFPEGELRREYRAWVAGLKSPTVPATEGLPADLAASQQWRYMQVELATAQTLAEFRGRESQRLAQLRETLVRSRLTELTNAGIVTGVPPAQARETAAEQQAQIWQEIEEQTQAEQQESEHRIVAEKRRLETQARAQKAVIEREINQEAAARRRAAQEIPELAGLRAEMTGRMEEVVAAGGVGERARQVSGAAPPATVRSSAEQAREEAFAEYEATRQRQLERLAEGQAATLRAIMQDMRRVVMMIAFRDNLRLHVIPAASPVGRDLTGEVRAKVQAVWAGRADLMKGRAQENIQQ
jgi:hypothetical protein